MKPILNDDLKSILAEIKYNNSNNKKDIVHAEKVVKNITTHFSNALSDISSFNGRLKSFNLKFNKKKDELSLEFKTKTNDLKIEINQDISSTNENFEQSLNEIKDNSNLKQSELVNQNTISNDKKEHFLLELKRATQKGLKEINNNTKEETVKAQSLINEENIRFEKLNQEIKSNHKLMIDDINLVSSDQLDQIEENISSIKSEQSIQKEQHDQSYLNIRSVYHDASKSFNEQIDKLKGEKTNLISKQTQIKEDRLAPFNSETNELDIYIQAIKTSTSKEYEVILEKHFQKLETLKINFENLKTKINNETNQAISVINTNYTNLQDVSNTEREKLKDELNVALSNTDNQYNKNDLKQQFNKTSKKIDQELIKQQKYRDQANYKKEQERYARLKNAESNYLKDRMNWRIEQQSKELEYNTSMNVINTYFDVKTEEIRNNVVLENDIHSVELAKIELFHLLAIAPLQSQLNIASLVQERDINLLNNESSSSSYLADVKIEENNLETLLVKNNNEFQLGMENLKFENTMNRESIINQLAVQKINTKKEHMSKYYELTSKGIKNSEQITQINKGIIYKTDQLTLNSKKRFEQELLILNTKHSNELLETEIDILNNKIKLETKKIEQAVQIKLYDFRKETNLAQINSLHEFSGSIYNEIGLSFNHINNLVNNFINLYKLLVKPDDLKKYLSFVNEVIILAKFNMYKILDELEVEINDYINNLINNLDHYKHRRSIFKRAREHTNNSEQLKLEINNINNQQTNISDQLYILEARLAAKNRELILLQKQVKTFRDDKSIKDNTNKLIRSLKTIKRQIKELEYRENDLNKKIIKLIKRRDKADLKDKNKSSNNGLVEQKKYRFQTRLIKKNSRISRQVKQLINKSLTKIINQNEGISSGTYLADSNIKYYENQISKISNSFNNNLSNYYQLLLKKISRFYYKLTKIQSKSFKKDDGYINRTIKSFNNTHNNYQLKLETLTNNHQEIILKLKNDYSNKLRDDTKKLIRNAKKPLDKLTKNQNELKTIINNFDSTLTNEFKLIEQNLHYSLKVYEKEFGTKTNSLKVKFNNENVKLRKSSLKRVKNYQSIYESLLIKNEQIIKAYQHNYQNALTNLKSLQKDLKQKNNDLNRRHQNLVKHNDQAQNDLKVKHQNLTKSYRSKYTKEMRAFERLSQVECRKQIKDMEKSINFKLKTLNLD